MYVWVYTGVYQKCSKNDSRKNRKAMDDPEYGQKFNDQILLLKIFSCLKKCFFKHNMILYYVLQDLQKDDLQKPMIYTKVPVKVRKRKIFTNRIYFVKIYERNDSISCGPLVKTVYKQKTYQTLYR